MVVQDIQGLYHFPVFEQHEDKLVALDEVHRVPELFHILRGVMHTLLGISDREDLYGYPNAGGSWEGFVIENLIAVATAVPTLIK